MNKYAKGSYTVEAAWILPFLLVIMAASIEIAIDFHEEVRKMAEENEEIEEIPIIKNFYQAEWVKEGLDGNGTGISEKFKK